MDIRYATLQEKNQVKALWRYAFDDTDSFVEYFFDRRYDPQNNIVLIEKEELRASLLVNPYKFHHGKINEQVRYIIGISVWPEHRGKKYTTLMLKKAFADCYDKGESISLLMPIHTGIYRRYGYENVFEMDSYTFSLEQLEQAMKGKKIEKNQAYTLARITLAKGQQEQDRLAEEQKIADLVTIYQQTATSWDNYLLRDADYFKTLYAEVKEEEGQIILCYGEQGKALGYMIFYPKFEPKQTGFVREMLALDSSVYAMFFSLIRSHRTQINQIVLHQPENSLLMEYLGQNNQITKEKKPFLMARILNVHQVLESVSQGTDCHLRIGVTDDMLPQNTGVYTLVQGKVSFQKQAGSEELSLSIGELTRLYMGRISYEDLCFLWGITPDENIKGAMTELFPRKISYINDYI